MGVFCKERQQFLRAAPFEPAKKILQLGQRAGLTLRFAGGTRDFLQWLSYLRQF